MAQLPLDRYKLFESNDITYTRDRLTELLCRHRMDVVGRTARLNAVVHGLTMQSIAISYVSYGEGVWVCTDEPESFLVIIPLAGHGILQSGAEQVQATPQRIGVVTAGQRLKMRLSADYAQLVLRIERPALDARLSEMTQGALVEPLRFELGMDVTGGYRRSWYGSLLHYVSDLNRPDTMFMHPLAIDKIERMLIMGLLLAQPHNCTAILNDGARPRYSRRVGIVVDSIEGHPEWAHTPASMARRAGVSVRAIQKAFREELGTSPSEYLREVRLQRVYNELLAAPADTTTVGEIARKWGFSHHGRFAAMYRERFGESPKETLRWLGPGL
ncbi:AraC family transcriptional regulator [Amycolatopsis nigrescens]|uniref:AraC family transcriptional regulator n=1 Tax=Amycolatopsis nigrescens TaxID=381445 RepID=UPI00037AA672|nr:AraC family transcriptional regulator [Amycolatopsis nigrescens]